MPEQKIMNQGFDGSFILSLIMAVAASVATYVNLKLKSDVQAIKSEFQQSNHVLENRISLKLDEFRREFAAGFLPATLAQEQRNNTAASIDTLRGEISINRTSIHRISNEIMVAYSNQVFRLSEMVTAQAERVAEARASLLAMDRRMDAIEDQLEELCRKA